MWAKSRKGLQLLKDLKQKQLLEDNEREKDNSRQPDNASTGSSTGTDSAYESAADSPQLPTVSLNPIRSNGHSYVRIDRELNDGPKKRPKVEIMGANGKIWRTRNGPGGDIPWISRDITETLANLSIANSHDSQVTARPQTDTTLTDHRVNTNTTLTDHRVNTDTTLTDHRVTTGDILKQHLADRRCQSIVADNRKTLLTGETFYGPPITGGSTQMDSTPYGRTGRISTRLRIQRVIKNDGLDD